MLELKLISVCVVCICNPVCAQTCTLCIYAGIHVLMWVSWLLKQKLDVFFHEGFSLCQTPHNPS